MATGERAREADRGRRQWRRLLDAVVGISADLDARTVLRRIVAAATEVLAARYGALGVLGEDGQFVDVITVGVDEERLKAASGIPQSHGLLSSLVTDRRPLSVPHVGADPRSVGFPPGHPVMESLLGVPLMVRGTVYGNLCVADKHDGTLFTDSDEALLAALGSAASVSIENARLYQRLSRAAEHFQRTMLPRLPDAAPIELAARYQPASELPRLGGDWYDALRLPDGALAVVVGDVTGHDVEAAPVMAQIRNMLRGVALDRCGPPSRILGTLDAAWAALGDEPAATLVLGRIETLPHGYSWCWSNAGHPPPLLVEADGTARYLSPAKHGIPVGIDPAVPRFDHVHPLPPGGTLLLFTDGLVERRGQDIEVGLDHLADHAARLAAVPVEELCDALLPAGQVFGDDVALLAVRLPAPAARSGR